MPIDDELMTAANAAPESASPGRIVGARNTKTGRFVTREQTMKRVSLDTFPISSLLGRKCCHHVCSQF